MTRLLTILVALCAWLGLPAAEEENLFVNPDMAEASDPPRAWSAHKGSIARDTTVFATAPGSLRLDTVDGGNANQAVTGLAGKQVRFQAQARSAPGGRVQAFAMIFTPDWKMLEWKTLRVIPPGDAWHAVDGIVEVPAGAGSVIFGIAGDGQATGWLDATSLREVAAAPAPAGAVSPDSFSPAPWVEPEGADVIQVSPITDRMLLVWFSEGIIDYAGAGQNPHVDSTPHFSLLDIERAVDPQRYVLTSTDDPAFAAGLTPTGLGRKTKGHQFNDVYAFQRKQPTHLSQHWIYLQLPQPLISGKHYTLKLDGLASNSDTWAFAFDENATRSESIRTNHLGYRPSSPKFAYVSQWLGDFDQAPHRDGGLDLSDYDGEEFRLVRVDDGSVVFRGTLSLQQAKTQRDVEKMPEYGPHGNMSRADVWQADFSAFDQPGRYRVAVRRMGCSLPFEIHAEVFRPAYVTAMRGLFFQRSGIDRQVREYGDLIYPGGHRSNRMFYLPTGDRGHPNKIQDLSRPIEGIWGWYHDAGDWDGYVHHLKVPAQLLLAYELDPTRFGDGDVGNRWRHPGTEAWIDEGTNGIPDILDEAGWQLAYMRRARHALIEAGYGTGGVPGYVGIEGCGSAGTGSWNDTRDLAVNGEDAGATAIYAGLAAWYGHALRTAGQPAEVVDAWLAEGTEAYQWATARTVDPKERTIAAAGLYRATGEARYQTDFLAAFDPKLNYDYWGGIAEYQLAACLYALLPADHPGLEAARQQDVRELILSALERFWLKDGLDRGFRATHLSFMQKAFLGAHSTPRTVYMQVAHAFTGEARFDHAAQFAADYTLGGNQMGLVWMSGLGWRHDTASFHPDSRVLLDVDSQVYGSTVLPGYTPYGSYPTFDHFSKGYVHAGSEDWSRSTAHPLIWRKVGASNQGLGPAWEKAADIPGWAAKDSIGAGPGNATAWPASELRFANHYSIPGSEFTMSQTLSHNVFTYAGLIGDSVRFAPQPPPEVDLQVTAGTRLRVGDTLRLAVETGPSTVQVDYFCGWHHLGSSTAARDGFALSWNTGRFKIQPGTHRITARAYAADGRSSIPAAAGEVDIVVVAE